MDTGILDPGCLSAEGRGDAPRAGPLHAAHSQPTNLSISQAGEAAPAGSLETSILHSPESRLG